MLVVSFGVLFGATLSNPVISTILLSLGIGALGFAFPPVWTMLQDIVPSNAIGVGSGVMNGLANGFSALVPLAIGFVIHITGSYAYGLYFLVCCSALSALIMLFMTIKGR
ncbi:putative permease [Burkholderia cepacia GG4]|uniref:Permease n=2 Tax=Burkholderia cepacia TaxID=292 RepID=A0A9W3K675_BURCE|nr:putative permease [Burkholderia cepacia GG4]